MSEHVTAATVDRDYLDPALEARAHNLRQFDPSPRVDSLLEILDELARRLPPGPTRKTFLGVVERTIASNLREGAAETSIAGAAETLSTDLRRIQRSGMPAVLAAKAIAHRLRSALDLLGDPSGHDHAEVLAACRALNGVLAVAPRAQILSPTVRHELGVAKYGLLAELVPEEDGAARSEASGAAATETRARRHGAG